MPRATNKGRAAGGGSGRGVAQGARSTGGGAGGFPAPAALVLRALPALLLPLAVGAFAAARQGTSALPLVLVAAALGVTISAAVRNGLLAALTTALSVGLLTSAAYVQELQSTSEQAVGELGPHARLTEDRSSPTAFAASGATAGIVAADAAVDLAPTTMETMSVVLPCAFEGEYAVKTVDALRKHTTRSRLKEIIVVDDGSKPPLSRDFPQRLLRGSSEAPVRLLRHEKTLGLIAAKKTGGDAATGDVIVFFDCHVKPRQGWEEAFLKQMKRAGDHRTVVVPTITSLDPDTWEESSYGAHSKACYLLWNADFTWLGNPGRDVPLMSGGLLALSRRWWQETEGYDPHMVAWGGENIDQSLRAWLCGGRIEVAEGAYVAHMWRDAKNPKTQLKYPIPTEDVMRNKARAVTAWLDEFKEKTLSFPEYEAFVTGQQKLGDMSNFARLKDKLKCQPFSAYIQRFSYVYVDTGLIPAEVFQLREESTGRCLERAPRESPPHGVVLAPCAGGGAGGGGAGQGAGGVPDLQLWHVANRDRQRPGGPCCSGLANWNFIQCLDAHVMGERVGTFECEISGHTDGQSFRLEADTGQLTWRRGAGCLAPSGSTDSGSSSAEAALEACSVKAEPLEEARRFRLVDASGSNCASVISTGAGQSPDVAPETRWRVEFRPCEPDDEQQVFRTKTMLDGLQVVAGASEFCLDSAGGGQLLVYPCYDEAVGNSNQIWQLRGGGKLVWEGPSGGGLKAFCAHERPSGGGGAAELGFKEVPIAQQLTLRTCSAKVGQHFERTDVQGDAGQETFLLKDADTGKCLGGMGAWEVLINRLHNRLAQLFQANAGGALEHGLRLGECSDRQRWRELKDRDQLQHASSQLCIDAGDESTPILYPCHEPKAQRKQRFRVLDVPGAVQLRSGWEDNGRKRYFEKCLDHSPEPLAEVLVQPCDVTRSTGIRWSRLAPRETPEHRLWLQASTRPPGEVGLGGPAAPP